MEHDNTTHQRILDAAERLFSEKGYAAVTLQDIARAVNLRHASLYYYAANGKEQLYVEVMERSFRRHGAGLTESIIAAGGDVRAQLHAVAAWFATQPPVDFGRMVRSDLPTIQSQAADRLVETGLDTVRVPIAAVIRNGVRTGVLQVRDPEFAAMGLVGLVQSVHNIPARFLPNEAARVAAAKESVDMLVDGWRVR